MILPAFSTALVAGLLPLAAALAAFSAMTDYTIPPAVIKTLMESDKECVMPWGFNITNFMIFTPAPGNNHSQLISFDFFDDPTKIATSCAFNESSVNVAPFDFTPRYPCDDWRVTFMWNNATQGLEMIERACPDVLTTSMEASGSIWVNGTLSCLEDDANGAYGPGLDCISFRKYEAKYYSLQPTPW
ncbi:uncharacterized protein PODANS_1_7080 [Podospora anserina S mat+]|uniref:Podospora anserina S mat+ genomic DNA chromosome 1, supercontig 1 n=1 Tax=Podospora anserina (strain S / ATCC MYA-4624 / DSM 980 / FGSC 10383) TaxID=515849 RepID=B2A8Q9_PODAN|nr:uncharacterized protein PODANS_1_7080 [Podospora anserina S mat+]CAP60410.1 unnamed protein product [Podospora anserina S mat+]CDP23049.1 Putative protein of unknown function [Podospora anserina S mat+]